MTERAKVKRGLSAASKAAARHLERNPDASADDLAKKFKIAITTVYRAPWWKARLKEQS